MYARRPGVKIAFMAQEICFMVRLYSKILGDAREMDDTSSRPQTGSRLHLTEVPHQTTQIGILYKNMLWYVACRGISCCGLWVKVFV